MPRKKQPSARKMNAIFQSVYDAGKPAERDGHALDAKKYAVICSGLIEAGTISIELGTWSKRMPLQDFIPDAYVAVTKPSRRTRIGDLIRKCHNREPWNARRRQRGSSLILPAVVSAPQLRVRGFRPDGAAIAYRGGKKLVVKSWMRVSP